MHIGIKLELFLVHDCYRHLLAELLSLWDLLPVEVEACTLTSERQIQSERSCPHVLSLASHHHKPFVDFLKIF